MAGSSHRSFPSETSSPSAVAVNALLCEAMAKKVFSVTFSGLPSSRTPNPLA